MGKVISVSVSYTDGNGTLETIISDPTSPVIDVDETDTDTDTVTNDVTDVDEETLGNSQVAPEIRQDFNFGHGLVFEDAIRNDSKKPKSL